MISQDTPSELLEFIIERVNLGIFVLDQTHSVVLWNGFMTAHSGITANEIVGKNLFEKFPELPQRWLEKKINSVFLLKNSAFTSWKQRSHLFQFRHNRPVTGGTEYMCQDITLMPIKNRDGDINKVCVVLFDTTDTANYYSLHQTAIKKLEDASRIDGLTQLFNRAHWQTRLSEEISRAARYNTGLSLILFDLDHFKSINDRYGHLAGDAVLIQVASLLKGLLREPDVAGRYGGEEFGIILPETCHTGAMKVAERLRIAIESTPVQTAKYSIRLSASLGITEYNANVNTGDDMIAAADKALYQAKENGRNRVEVALIDEKK